MPRIPQAEFDTGISQSAPAATVRPPDNSEGEFVQSLAKFTGVMAQLQDQTERTDAYAYANDAKRKHLERKARYSAALESVNGAGMTDYEDPFDMNPDPNKRRRIQRPIQEMYKEMVDSYEEDRKGASKLTRSDIANELMMDYVGDDLINTQLNTNKLLNKVRTKETSDRVQQNLELHLSNFVSQATAPDANPELVNLSGVKMRNAVQRELGTVSNIIGREGVKQFQQLSDRAMATAASQIVSTGVTNTTVKAADDLIAGIRDPGERQAASIRLENVKKSTATVKNLTQLDGNKGLIAAVSVAPAIDDINYVKGMEQVKNTFNMYIDPKYSTVTNDQKLQSGTDLASSLLSKRWLQQNITTDLTFLQQTGGAARSPAAGEQQLNDLRAAIDTELKSSGIAAMMGSDDLTLQNVREMTIKKLRMEQANAGKNIAAMVKATNPGKIGLELYKTIDQAAVAQAAGVPALVDEKESNAFGKVMEDEIINNPSNAVSIFNQQLSQAGSAFEGEASYRRRLARDLVGDNGKLSYLIPMADADPIMQDRMARNAAIFNSIDKEVEGVTPSTFEEAFYGTDERTGLVGIRDADVRLYNGVKQAIFHEAAANIKSKGDVKSAVSAAAEKYSKLYTVMPMGDSGSTVFALNRGTDYSAKKREIAAGTEKALTLPKLSIDEKVALFNRYKPGVLKEGEKPPAHQIDFLLQRNISIVPDPKYPNVHYYQIGTRPIAKEDGTLLKIHVDDIVGYGEERRNQYKRPVTEPQYDSGYKL